MSEQLMGTALPETLSRPSDFEALADAASAALEYADAVFDCASGRGGAEPPADDAEEAKLRGDMLKVADSFEEFWMERADEVSAERQLSADDASPHRIPADVVCMTAIAYAEATALSVGARPDFDDATALSFAPVRRQLLAQTPRRIREYGPSDLARALDALSHAWHRARVDDGVLAYARALRLRFGMLLRCAARRLPGDPPTPPADAALMTEPAPMPAGGEARLLAPEFVQEMTQRFRALAEMAWIRRCHGREWTREELRGALDAAARMGEPESCAEQVMAMLRDYARATSGAGSVSEQVRACYLERWLGPGDEGAFLARNPNYCAVAARQLPAKHVVRACRGGKFFTAASHRSIEEPHEALDEGLALMRERAGAAIGERSLARLHDEIFGLCAFDCLLKGGRYGVPWRDRFVVTRETYRAARDMGLLAAGALPVALSWASSWDLLWGGRILRTSSLFETVAWWLEIVRVTRGGELPASVALFRGGIAAARRRGAGAGAGDEGDVAVLVDGQDDDDRVARVTREMRRRATRIDLRNLCEVTGPGGAAAVEVRPDSRQRCTVLSESRVSY